jgi:hypothetical protein
MDESDGIGRAIPVDRSGDSPRRRQPPRKPKDAVEDEDELLDEAIENDDEEGLPEEVLKKRREGREVAPKGKDEEGQIIDILA